MFDDLAVTFYNNVVAAYDEYVAHRDSPEAEGTGTSGPLWQQQPSFITFANTSPAA